MAVPTYSRPPTPDSHGGTGEFAPTSKYSYWTQLAALSIAYFAASQLGLLLQPTGAMGSPFWPAAGIALAGLVVGGIRLWPAIAVAKLAESAWSLSQGHPDLPLRTLGLVAVAASLAVTLQAIAGAFAVGGRRTSFAFPANDRQIAKLILVAGGLCSVINASMGTAAIYATGLIDTDQVWWTWITTWFGDAAGVFLVAPLVLLWCAVPGGRSIRRLAIYGLPLLVFVAVVLVIAAQISVAERLRWRNDFERQAFAVTDDVRDQFGAAFESLYAVRGLFAASEEVTATNFDRFASAYLQRRPPLLGVGWLPRVDGKRRIEFERDVAAEGRPGFRILEHDVNDRVSIARARDEYFPIRFASTKHATLARYGYDVLSLAPWRAAGQHARDRGELVVSSPVSLNTTMGSIPGILALLPVYADGPEPQTVEARRGALRGYAAALLDPEALLSAAIDENSKEMVGVLSDVTTEGRSFTLSMFAAMGENESPQTIAELASSSQILEWPMVEHTIDVDAAGRTWSLRVATVEEPILLASPERWWLTLGSALSAAVIGAFTLVLASRAAQVEEKVNVRTRELAAEVAERRRAEAAAQASQAWLELAQTSAGIGVWEWDVATDEVHVSPGQSRLFGLGEDGSRLSAARWREMVHCDDRQRVREDGRRALAQGNTYTSECRVEWPDGTTRWLIHNGRVERDASGRATRIIGASWDITEAKARGAEVDEQQRRFRALTQNSEIGFWQVAPNGRAVYLNAALCKLLEVDRPEQAMGFDSSEFFTAQSQETLRRERENRRRGLSSTYEATIVGMRGRRRAVMISAAPILDVSGNLQSTIGSYIDITELKETEQRLRASENELASIYHGVSDAVSLWKVERSSEGIDYRCLRVNRSAVEFFGIEERAVVGRLFREFAPPSIAESLVALARRAVDQRYPVEFVETIETPSGRHTFDVRFSPLFGEDGDCTHLLTAAHDVTDRVAAEAGLHRAVEFRESIIQHAGEGLCVSETIETPPYARFSVWNRQLEEITGYTLDDVNRHEWLPLIFRDPETRSVMESVRDRVRGGESVRDKVVNVTRRDGERRIVRFSTTQLTGARGELLVLTFVDDMTEQERAVAALRSSEERYRGVVSAMAEGVLLVDERRTVEACNASLCKILGIPESQIVGRDVLELFSAARDELDRPFGETDFAIAVSLAEGTSRERRILRIPLPDGQSRWLSANTRTIFDPQGEPKAAIATITDITNAKLTAERLRSQEQQLAHVSRVSTMGEFVAGIAHEINQPLHAIANFANACERSLVGDEAGELQVKNALAWTRHINASVRQAGSVIRRLRDYFRRDAAHREPVSLAATVRESLDLTQFLVRQHDVTIELDLSSANEQLTIDRVQIQQVMVNLLRNAIEAVAPLPPPRRRIAVRAVRHAKDVEVIVADDGPGVPSEGVARLFEPFYTTKADGMGMGLAISKTIIEAHGGEIWYRSRDGSGGEFHFTLANVIAGTREHAVTEGKERVGT